MDNDTVGITYVYLHGEWLRWNVQGIFAWALAAFEIYEHLLITHL
jgi:hypothetical protein